MNEQPQPETSLTKDPQLIRRMFADIARRYDRANNILSSGVHRRWKERLVLESKVQPGERVLDCATGTGDLALLFAERLKGQGEVVGCDFCEPMLSRAREKAEMRHLAVKFEIADVMKLPYPDHSFDVVTIGFGIRNVADPFIALQEMARVLKPHGRMLILEFGQVWMPVARQLYGFYAERILPLMGRLITGNKDAYQYLVRSSADFPSGSAFVGLMRRTLMLTDVQSKSLSWGIAYLYSARSLLDQSK